MRLTHVLGRVFVGGAQPRIEAMRDVIAAMVEDVYREGKGEVVESKEATAAIGRKTAAMFKARLQAALRAGDAR